MSKKFKVGAVLEYEGGNPFVEQPQYVIDEIRKDNVGREWAHVSEINGREAYSALLKTMKREMVRVK